MKLFNIYFIYYLVVFSSKIFCFYKTTCLRILNFDNSINIFVMAHKDFYNARNNQIYKIVTDDKTQLKNKYNLTIIYADKGMLYQKRHCYAEMSKLYYIYQLYKSGNLSSKYIGLNHYRRYFNFLDNIPDFDEIFKNFDVILNSKTPLKTSIIMHYCDSTFCKPLLEIINIIKEKKPEYYKTAINALNSKEIYFSNIFIMKKEDFFKYCEFVYDILFELDRRNNFTSDKDVSYYLGNYYPETMIDNHMRIQGFLSERLSTIFFEHNFKRIKTFPIVKFDKDLAQDTESENEKKIYFK